MTCQYFKSVPKCPPLTHARLKSPSKQSRVARAWVLTSSIVSDTLRLRGVEIALSLNLTPSAVSKLAAKGHDDPLSDEIERRLFGKQ